MDRDPGRQGNPSLLPAQIRTPDALTVTEAGAGGRGRVGRRPRPFREQGVESVVQLLSRACRVLAALAAGGGLALLAASGGAAAQGSAQVTGEVFYRERIALPPGARVTVQLQDVSRAGAPAVVLAEQIVDPAGRAPPYAFALPYDPARIIATGSYVVRAQIRVEDRLLFTSTSSYPVITRGAPTSGLQVLVQQVGGGSGTPPGQPGLPATGGGSSSGGGGGGIPGALAPAAWLVPAAVLLGLGARLRRFRGADA
jgi:uncharacterized lipoprotein YbaY